MKTNFIDERNTVLTSAVNGTVCGAAFGVSLAVCARMFGSAARFPLPKKIIRAGTAFGLLGGAAGFGTACIGVTSLNFFVNRAAKEQEKAFTAQQRKQMQTRQMSEPGSSRGQDEHISSLKT